MASNIPDGRAAAKVMNRSDLTRRLVARLKSDEAVIGGIGHTHFDLWAAAQRPQNFYMLGSMGLAIPIALGVAIAQPQRRVIALEGDGSLLMQLGVLGTVASVRPKNLVMVVWDNGAYQITGGQPTLTSTTVDLVAIAQGRRAGAQRLGRGRSALRIAAGAGACRCRAAVHLRAHRSAAAGRRHRTRCRQDPRPVHGCHGRTLTREQSSPREQA